MIFFASVVGFAGLLMTASDDWHKAAVGAVLILIAGLLFAVEHLIDAAARADASDRVDIEE